VLHGHDLNHVQVGLLGGTVDSKDSVDNIGGELLGEGIVQFGGKRCAGDGEQELAVNGSLKLEVVEELQYLSD
jgi:hypothetical protein